MNKKMIALFSSAMLLTACGTSKEEEVNEEQQAEENLAKQIEQDDELEKFISEYELKEPLSMDEDWNGQLSMGSDEEGNNENEEDVVENEVPDDAETKNYLEYIQTLSQNALAKNGTLSTGTYTIGESVPEGRYNIFPEDSKTNIITSKPDSGEEKWFLTELTTREDMPSQATIYLENGMKLEVLDGKAVINLATPLPEKPTELNSGVYMVGVDVPPTIKQLSVDTGDIAIIQVFRGTDKTYDRYVFLDSADKSTIRQLDLKVGDTLMIRDANKVRVTY